MANSSRFVKNPLIVALDVDDGEEALDLAIQLRDVAGCFKVGPRLVLRHGPELVEELSTFAPVFLDHKFYDIPSVMEASLRAAFDMGVTLATVHASAGAETLRQLAGLQKELSLIRPFCILGVTVLTSVKAENAEILQNQIRALAKTVAECGIGGLVCSPHEVAGLKALYPNLFYVTPGIRSATDNMDDQKRTMSAQEALKQGSSAVVVGRPILKAADPIRAAQNLLSELV